MFNKTNETVAARTRIVRPAAAVIAAVLFAVLLGATAERASAHIYNDHRVYNAQCVQETQFLAMVGTGGSLWLPRRCGQKTAGVTTGNG